MPGCRRGEGCSEVLGPNRGPNAPNGTWGERWNLYWSGTLRVDFNEQPHAQQSTSFRTPNTCPDTVSFSQIESQERSVTRPRFLTALLQKDPALFRRTKPTDSIGWVRRPVRRATRCRPNRGSKESIPCVPKPGETVSIGRWATEPFGCFIVRPKDIA